MLVLIVIISLSILILGHEAGHFFVAKKSGMRVDEFGIGFPPRMWGKKVKDTIYSINWLPFGGFVKIAGEDKRFEDDGEFESIPESEKRQYFFFQPAWKRAMVLSAGVIMNLVLGWIFISAVFMIGTPPVLVITGIEQDSPAESVELLAGDIVKDFSNADEFIAFVNENKGKEISFSVLREGREVEVIATPRVEVPEGSGALGVFLADGGVESTSFLNGLWEGLLATGRIIYATVIAFYQVIKGLILNASLIEGVAGPVGIVATATGVARVGIAYLVQIIGVISINLAVLNLIPIPALDGGRLVLLLAEKLRGKPLPKKFEAAVNGVGFVFLVLLMVLVTVRDVGRLF